MLLKSCKSAKIEVTTNNKQQTTNIFTRRKTTMNILASTVIALSLFGGSNAATPHNEVHVNESGVLFTVQGSSGSLTGVTV